VVELADIFRRFADAYLAAHGTAMPASHRRAIADIIACRTEALGGHLWRCDRCSAEVFAYHSCKNRSCPKCHTEQTQVWLERRQAEMLPAPYFHVTITVPEELRQTLRSNQRDGYSVLLKASAEAIIELARDRRFVGGTVGVMAVLHTWTQQLHYHPHVHCLVTAGGVSTDSRSWCPARKGFLFPPKALAKLVRGKLRAMLRRRRPDLVLPPGAWRKPWIVHITPWGEGEQASQVLFGELAKLVGNGTGNPQRHRRISDSIPSEAIADPIDSSVGHPTRHAFLGTGAARLIFETKREFQLHIPVLLEMRHGDR